MKISILILTIFSFLLISCQPTQSQPSGILELQQSEPTSTADPATLSCPNDELADYVRNYKQIMSDFLETSKIATFMAEKRLEATIVMLSSISDLEIVNVPECAQAHKERAIAAMHKLVDATLELESNSELTDADAKLLEPALLEIGKLNDEVDAFEASLQ